MRVAIDARMLTGTAMHGIARYVLQLLRGLVKEQSSLELFVLVGRDTPLPGLLGNEVARQPTFITCGSPWISIGEQGELPRLLRRQRIDLFHSPSFVALLGCSIPQLLTIHDLNHLALPHYYSPLHRLYYEQVVKRVARRAPLVLTVSRFSQGELCRWLSKKPDQVVVTYNGVDASFKRVEDPLSRSFVKRHYRLPESFIFCLGSSRPHKNNRALLEAYERSQVSLPLVISTPPAELGQLILAAKNKGSEVIALPFIDDAHLPTIYSLAELLVFPSLYEGFGLPALEAMACGCPVLLSESSSLPEIAGEFGFYFDPLNVEAMAQGLRATLAQLGRETAERREQRIKHARSFTWDRLVHDTVATYERFLQ